MELWILRSRIFDQLLYFCEIDLMPILLHPNCSIDRWFNVIRAGSDNNFGESGKLLVDFFYEIDSEDVDITQSHEQHFETVSVQPSTPERSQEEPIRAISAENEGLALDLTVPDQREEVERIHNLVNSLEIEKSVHRSPENVELKPTTESSNLLSSILVDSVEKTVSTLGNLLYDLETKSLDTTDPAGIADEKATDGLSQPLPSSSCSSSEKETLAVGTLVIGINSVLRYDVRDAAEGDHYFTIEIDQAIKFQSHIVRNSATPIFNSSARLKIPHFRALIDVSLWDARSATKLGSSRVTAYHLKQRTTDAYLWKSMGYTNNSLPIFDIGGQREIGYFSGSFQFEEDVYHHYYSSAVRYAPSSPEEDLSVERLGIHIARFKDIFNLISQVYEEYLYIMNWTDPLLTTVLFILFLYCTLQVPPDYGLSGVFFLIVLLMTRTLLRRSNGEYLRVYLSKGAKDADPEYRPLANLKIGVLAFKVRNKTSSTSSRFGFLVPSVPDDISSRAPVLKVTFSPCPEIGQGGGVAKEQLVGYLGVSDSMISEGSSGVTQFVNSFLGSEADKVDWHITNVMDCWDQSVDRDTLDRVGGIKGCTPAGSADCCLVYRIPQPITSKLLSPPHPQTVQSSESADLYALPSLSPFLPWSQNSSVLNIFLLPTSGQQLSENYQEYIKIPIKDLFQFSKVTRSDLKGRKSMKIEVVKWFRTQKKSVTGKNQEPRTAESGDVLTVDSLDSSFDKGLLASHDGSVKGRDRNLSEDQLDPSSADTTEVLLRLELRLPSERSAVSPTELEKTQSQTLQTILSGRTDKETSTFTVLWNMRDHVRYVQNLMSWILDILESFKNIFNWTTPSKTFPIYLFFISLWILTVLIPGRILILLVGLYEFLYIFLPIPDGDEISIRFINLLTSIPNDDDLIQIYSNERSQYQKKKLEERKRQSNDILLNISLPCRWSGEAFVKWNSGSSVTVDSVDWISSFVMLQGKRILWWTMDSSFSPPAAPSKPPKGQVLLTPHSGLTQVSPVDLRQLTAEHPSLTANELIAVFGQDSSGKPVKLSVGFDNPATKSEVEAMITSIIQGQM